MLLAVGNVVGPITGVSGVVVQKREWTLLVGGGAVPALPVSSAGGSVGEDAILPVAVLRTFGRLAHHSVVLIRTSNLVRVITVFQETLPLTSCIETLVGGGDRTCFREFDNSET